MKSSAAYMYVTRLKSRLTDVKVTCNTQGSAQSTLDETWEHWAHQYLYVENLRYKWHAMQYETIAIPIRDITDFKWILITWRNGVESTCDVTVMQMPQPFTNTINFAYIFKYTVIHNYKIYLQAILEIWWSVFFCWLVTARGFSLITASCHLPLSSLPLSDIFKFIILFTYRWWYNWHWQST